MTPPTPGTTNRVLLIQALAEDGRGGPFTVTWLSVAGATYRVDYQDDLVQTNWIPLGVITSATAQASMTDTNPPAGQRFYRITTE